MPRCVGSLKAGQHDAFVLHAADAGTISAGLGENGFLVDRLMAFTDDPDR